MDAGQKRLPEQCYETTTLDGKFQWKLKFKLQQDGEENDVRRCLKVKTREEFLKASELMEAARSLFPREVFTLQYLDDDDLIDLQTDSEVEEALITLAETESKSREFVFHLKRSESFGTEETSVDNELVPSEGKDIAPPVIPMLRCISDPSLHIEGMPRAGPPETKLQRQKTPPLTSSGPGLHESVYLPISTPEANVNVELWMCQTCLLTNKIDRVHCEVCRTESPISQHGRPQTPSFSNVPLSLR